MDVSTLRLLDQALFLLHAALVLFILTGWSWQRTRRLHLLVVVLTLTSWVGLGVWYGWGYCPLTDWHWQVKAALGETGLPASYIKYSADALTGTSWNTMLVDVWVVGLALAALVLARAASRAPRQASPAARDRRSGRSRSAVGNLVRGGQATQSRGGWALAGERQLPDRSTAITGFREAATRGSWPSVLTSATGQFRILAYCCPGSVAARTADTRQNQR